MWLFAPRIDDRGAVFSSTGNLACAASCCVLGFAMQEMSAALDNIGFQWDRLQPVFLRSLDTILGESQDRKDCGVAKAHRQECLCH
jgi:hypothetical protein